MPCISSSTASSCSDLSFSSSALAGSPGGEEHLHPTFGVERAQHFQAVFFVTDLLQLKAAGMGRKRVNHVLVLAYS